MVRRLYGLLGAAVLVLAAAVAAAAAPADAAVPAHYPVGRLESVRVGGAADAAVPTGWHSGSYLTVTGWSFDPDAASTPEIVRSYDGSALRWRNHTSLYRADVDRAYRIAGIHGYRTRYAVSNGRHHICTVQENVGAGESVYSDCIDVTVNGSPYGRLDSLTATSQSTLRFSGWAADPDDTRVSSSIHYTVDGGAASASASGVAGDVRTDVNRAVRIPGNHGFSVEVPVPNIGTHRVCVVALNYGPSAPATDLGCRSVGMPPAIQTTALPGGEVAQSYQYALGATNTDPSTTWAITSGALPAGLQLLGSIITGRPTAAGTATVDVTVTTASGHDTRTLSITVDPIPWSASLQPVPADRSPDYLLGAGGELACASATSCVFVDSYRTTSGTTRQLVETLADGTWTTGVLPVPDDAAADPAQVVFGVACGSPTDCAAVGQYTATDGHPHGLLETLAAGTWTAQRAAVPAGLDYSVALRSVACPAPGSCVAVGSAAERPLIETLAAGQWSGAVAPTPAGVTLTSSTELDLEGVSCASATLCQAVGSYSSGAGTQGLIETYDGAGWTATPSPDSSITGLEAISCAPNATCAAIARYSSFPYWAFATYANGTWAAQLATLGVQNSGAAQFNSIACGTTECFATGEQSNRQIEDAIYPANGAGTAPGVRLSLPSDASVLDNSLNSVACAGGSTCAAVGTYYTTGGPISGLIQTFPHPGWAPLTAPTPAPASEHVELFRVACPTTTDCIAVGSYTDPPGSADRLLVETYHAP